MKYRARANGNILDSVPESLIGVLYDPVEDEDGAEDKPQQKRRSGLATPEAPVENVAHTGEPNEARDTAVEPVSTDDMPTKGRKRGRGKRKK